MADDDTRKEGEALGSGESSTEGYMIWIHKDYRTPIHDLGYLKH